MIPLEGRSTMCWESYIGWRNGLAGISESSEKASAKSCTWRGVTLLAVEVDGIESNCVGNHCGVLADSKSINQLYAPEMKKASCILNCIGKRVASRGRAVIIPITLTLVQLHLEYFIQFWVSQYEKDFDISEWVPWRATKKVQGFVPF